MFLPVSSYSCSSLELSLVSTTKFHWLAAKHLAPGVWQQSAMNCSQNVHLAGHPEYGAVQGRLGIASLVKSGDNHLIETASEVRVVDVEVLCHRVDKVHHIFRDIVVSHLATLGVAKELKPRSISVINRNAGLCPHFCKPDMERLAFISVVDYVEIVDEHGSNPLKHLHFERFVQPHPVVQRVPCTCASNIKVTQLKPVSPIWTM